MYLLSWGETKVLHILSIFNRCLHQLRWAIFKYSKSIIVWTRLIMKKQIFPLQRKSKKLRQRIYEHLGNGYYRDMRTGKIIDKYLQQNTFNRSGTKLSWPKLDFLFCRSITPLYSIKWTTPKWKKLIAKF